MPKEKDYLPVYRETLSYANENGELEQYRNSRRENIACREAIEVAIKNHFDGMHFDPAGVKEVFNEYGKDRTMFVLAVTVQDMEWDGRYSPSNKEWAKTFNIPEDRDAFLGDHRLDYVVKSHPVLVDAFLNDARKEVARNPSIMEKLNMPRQKEQAPPHKTKKQEAEL